MEIEYIFFKLNSFLQSEKLVDTVELEKRYEEGGIFVRIFPIKTFSNQLLINPHLPPLPHARKITSDLNESGIETNSDNIQVALNRFQLDESYNYMTDKEIWESSLCQ